jgi:hypothetical protein
MRCRLPLPVGARPRWLYVHEHHRTFAISLSTLFARGCWPLLERFGSRCLRRATGAAKRRIALEAPPQHPLAYSQLPGERSERRETNSYAIRQSLLALSWASHCADPPQSAGTQGRGPTPYDRNPRQMGTFCRESGKWLQASKGVAGGLDQGDACLLQRPIRWRSIRPPP